MNRFSCCFFALLLAANFAAAQAPSPSLATPAARAPITTTDSPEVIQFQKIEDSWSDSINQRDQYGLELVLSPYFVDVSATGDITTRNQQLAQVVAGVDRTLHITQRIITVRLLGDIAVANGTYVLHHKVSTVVVDENGVFTHVFERVHGGWVCVNSQRTALREDSNGVKTKKSSSAEMPFHIPFVGKSN